MHMPFALSCIITLSTISFGMTKKEYTLSHVCYLYDDTENALIPNRTKTVSVSDFSKNKNTLGFIQHIYYNPDPLTSIISLIIPCIKKPKRVTSMAYVTLNIENGEPQNYKESKQENIIEKKSLKRIQPLIKSCFCYDGHAQYGPLILQPEQEDIGVGCSIKIDAVSDNSSLVIGKLFSPPRFYLWKNSGTLESIVLKPIQELHALNEILSAITKIIFFDEKTIIVFLNDGTVRKIIV